MEFPSLRNEKTRRIFDWGDVYTDNISAKCHRALTCPLCHSKEVTVENDFYSANLLYAQYFLLENIVHTECKSCKTEFFTQDQLKVMLAEMAKAQAEAQEKVAELTQ